MSQQSSPINPRSQPIRLAIGTVDGSQEDALNRASSFHPGELAGLREQKRQYTKELLSEQQQKKQPQIDPNRAYPNFLESNPLLLCEFPSIP